MAITAHTNRRLKLLSLIVLTIIFIGIRTDKVEAATVGDVLSASVCHCRDGFDGSANLHGTASVSYGCDGNSTSCSNISGGALQIIYLEYGNGALTNNDNKATNNYFVNASGGTTTVGQGYNRSCTLGITYVAACRCTNTSHSSTPNLRDSDASGLAKYHHGVANGKNAHRYQFSNSNVYCGLTGMDTLGPLGHTNDTGEGTDDTTTPAKCTKKGKIVHKCKRCEHTTSEDINPLSHNIGNWHTTNDMKDGAVNVENGYRYKQCERTKTECDYYSEHDKRYIDAKQYKVNVQYNQDALEKFEVNDEDELGSHNFWFTKGTKNIKILCKMNSGYSFGGYEKNDRVSGNKSDKTFTFETDTSGITNAHSWKLKTTTIYSITYTKGTTNQSGANQSQTNLKYGEPVTLKPSNTFTGSYYQVLFDNNESTYDTTTSISSTSATPVTKIDGYLGFSKWQLTAADATMGYNLYTLFNASQTVNDGNFTTKPNGSATLTATYNNATIDITSKIPTRPGYTFDGWFDARSGGNQITSVSFSPSTGALSKTVYAHWTPITYTVRFNGNGNWNRTQGSYTQTMTFDKIESFIPNRFNRLDGQDGSWHIWDIIKGYAFQGWTQTQNSWTIGTNYEGTTTSWAYNSGKTNQIKLVDRATGVFNLTSTPGATIDLYAIWKKPIKITFKLQDGTYKGKPDDIVINSNIWNTQANYTFKIDNTLQTQLVNKYENQVGQLWAYGTGYNSNGINNDFTKTDKNGVEYRFLGWNTDPNATVPLYDYDVYRTAHALNVTIYDDLTLYAIYEPILKANVIVERVLGDLELGIKKKASATAIQPDTIRLLIKSGEQGSYKMSCSGTNVKSKIDFDTTITQIYNNVGLWTDKLNPNPSILAGTPVDGISLSEKHGLNRQMNLSPLLPIERKFYIPQYLGTKDSEPSSIDKTKYIIQFNFKGDSYYWEKYKGKKEEATVITDIELPSSGGPIEPLQGSVHTKIKNDR